MKTPIQTYTGRRFDVLEPDPALVDVRDIAHALSLQCRFSGHTREHYSVAQHSVGVMHLALSLCPAAPIAALRQALMHDATEAYMIDIPGPLKREPRFARLWRPIEGRLHCAIADALGIPRRAYPVVKIADSIMLAAEMRDLLPRVTEDAKPNLKLANEWVGLIHPWEPRYAEERFLFTWRQLCQ